MFARIKGFEFEEEAVVACSELTKQSIGAKYTFRDGEFVLQAIEREREIAINIVANSEALLALHQELIAKQSDKAA